MTEQRERIEKVLIACAETRVPDTADPWPEIKERVGERVAAVSHCSPRRFRVVPRTRAGLAVAAVLVMLFGMGAYAASGLLYETFRLYLPGAQGEVFGEKIDLDQEQTANGVRINLEWAYADAENIAVAYTVTELQEGRRVAGHPAELETLFISDEGGTNEQRLDERYPDRVKLTDGSGRDFDGSDGQTYGSEGSSPMTKVPNVWVFEPEEGLEPGSDHRFHLEIPVQARALDLSKGEKVQPESVGEPFVFDFEILVLPAPTIEVDQEVEASGVTFTLKRVVDSPARPEAVLCYGSPDTRYDWSFSGERDIFFGGGPLIGDDHACTSVMLPYQLDGRSTVTVDRLEGIPGCPAGDEDGCTIPRSEEKTVRGPWTFEFEVPER